MMSGAVIHQLSQEQAVRAAEENKRPFVFFNSDEIDGCPPFPFPNIGDYRPEGWNFVTSYFCDKLGFGAENEPAFSIEQTKTELHRAVGLAEMLDQTVGFAIIEEGEFQVVVGAFRKLPARKRSEKPA